MKKRIICIFAGTVTVILFTVLLAVCANAAVTKEGTLAFEDVKSTYWFADAVEFCYVNDVIDGMNEYTFSHAGKLTRAQFVTMLANAESIDTEEYSTDIFSDVKPTHWYYRSVSWAVSCGITAGTDKNKFSPNTYITREQMSVMLTRYMERTGCEVQFNDRCLDGFSDRYNITPYAVNGVMYTVSAGLIEGMTPTELAPRATVTRAQAARIFLIYLRDYRYSGHIHEFTDASCTEPPACSVCGIKSGLALGHDVSDGFNCGSDTQSKCRRCGYWVSASAMPHEFADATCSKPRICKYCSLTRGTPTGEHVWWAATCKNPKMCKVCYKTEGKALGHTTGNGMCTRCKTLNFTSDFNKVAYHLKTGGTYHSLYGVYYVSDYYEFEDGDTLNVTLNYDTSLNKIYIEYSYVFLNGASDELLIEIYSGSASYHFTYTFMNGEMQTFRGEGYIDPKNYRKGMGESFDSYSGRLTSAINGYLDETLDSSLDLTDGTLDYLYGGSIKDLGFSSYAV